MSSARLAASGTRRRRATQNVHALCVSSLSAARYGGRVVGGAQPGAVYAEEAATRPSVARAAIRRAVSGSAPYLRSTVACSRGARSAGRQAQPHGTDTYEKSSVRRRRSDLLLCEWPLTRDIAQPHGSRSVSTAATCAAVCVSKSSCATCGTGTSLAKSYASYSPVQLRSPAPRVHACSGPVAFRRGVSAVAVCGKCAVRIPRLVSMQSTIRVPLVPSAMLNSSRRDRFDGGQPTAAPAAGHAAAPNLLTYRAVSAPSPPLRETAPGTSGLSECSASAKSAAGARGRRAARPRRRCGGRWRRRRRRPHLLRRPATRTRWMWVAWAYSCTSRRLRRSSSAISAGGTSPADAVECDRVMR